MKKISNRIRTAVLASGGLVAMVATVAAGVKWH